MPTNPYEPPQQEAGPLLPRQRFLIRIGLQAIGMGIFFNVLAWTFIFLSDWDLPRYMMSVGFGLAWHAPVGPVMKSVLLFAVNITIWTMLSIPFVLGANVMYDKGKARFETR